MPRSGGAVIPMQLNTDVVNRVVYLTGSAEIVQNLSAIPAKTPFDDTVVDFTDALRIQKAKATISE